MLAEGRSLSEVLEIAARVFGPPENIYAKQNGVYACLGALAGLVLAVAICGATGWR